MRRIRLLLQALTVLACADLAAQFQTIETANLRLVYTSAQQSYLVPQVARSFENALIFHRELFDYTPPGRINLLIHDLWHYGNAGARPVPENHITVGIGPFSHVYESAPANERMNSSMNHELAHIVTVDKATASDHRFRWLFGGKVTPIAEQPLSMFYSFLTTPRWYSPRWFLEGIAVYLETWMNGGLGRVIGAYDEMVFRTLVRDSARIYDVVGLESEGTTIDFQVGVNSYLYGTRFISYLALQYGHDSLLAWVTRREGSKRYFARQFRQVYGASLDDEWARWIAWERDWQRANLEAIRRNPTTPSRPLSEQALGSVSRAYYDSTSNNLYVGVQYPGQVAHIAAINVGSGRLTKVHEVLGAEVFSVTSPAFDPVSRTLFYTTNNNDWRHLVALNLETGHSRMLMRDSRVGDLVYNAADSALWGVRHDNGFSTLVRIPPPYDQWNQVYTLPYGRDLFDLDISPDGTMLVGSMSEISGDQRLVAMDVAALRAGDQSHRVLFEFGSWSPSNFVFSPDGQYLYGSSYFSGVSNIFRYEVATGSMLPMSNAETGFFRPVPFSDDSLIVFTYAGRGFVPSMIPNAVVERVSAIQFLGNAIADQRPEVRAWELPHASRITLDSLTPATGTYSSFGTFKLDNIYPVVEGYEDAVGTFAVAGGLRFNLSDRIGTTALDVTTSYSPHPDLEPFQRFHAAADLQHWNWSVTAAVNRADFYDLFGPSRTSRRGYSLALRYKDNLLYDAPRSLSYTLSLAGYAGLTTVPEYQGVAASYDKILSGSASLEYGSRRASLGAIDAELGGTWALHLRSNYVNRAVYPRVNLDFSRGFLLPLNHSSIWFRGSAGAALAGDRNEPFANFYFGGFGNNWVDHRAHRQFRITESFPGMEINAIWGTTYGRAQVEWMLPPLRFRQVGIPSFYLRWAGLTFFGTGLMTNLDDTAVRRTVGSVGAQLDFRIVTLSHLNSTLSVGFAVAGEQGRPAESQLMVSFKIL
ncbi:MAG: hypothetical protein WD934_08520 [Gemmatimonadales bacterium]